ncbi:uncharacterized protein LOC127005716 [Eriocheir sinensis]|uniref:uncharacterized protein LOC127005716 n=1 Tax=Eriocheir sinensis TaxID=95602 RepID=UPI0021C582BE|nr:uncharacterized protein LOC127005716 [Eriocheir sinensis]
MGHIATLRKSSKLLSMAKIVLFCAEFLLCLTPVPAIYTGDSYPKKIEIKDNWYVWWCDRDQVFDSSRLPAGLGSEFKSPGSCEAVKDTDQNFGGCDTSPPDLENSDKTWEHPLYSGTTQVAFYRHCNGDTRIWSQRRGKFTYCIDRDWTPMDDLCYPKCDRPTDCSEVNSNQDDTFEICTQEYAFPIKVYCDAAFDYTLVLQLIEMKRDLKLSKQDSQYPQGDYTTNSYFIGKQRPSICAF